MANQRPESKTQTLAQLRCSPGTVDISHKVQTPSGESRDTATCAATPSPKADAGLQTTRHSRTYDYNVSIQSLTFRHQEGRAGQVGEPLEMHVCDRSAEGGVRKTAAASKTVAGFRLNQRHPTCKHDMICQRRPLHRPAASRPS